MKSSLMMIRKLFFSIGDVEAETVDVVTELDLEQDNVAGQVDLVNTPLINAAAGSRQEYRH